MFFQRLYFNELCHKGEEVTMKQIPFIIGILVVCATPAIANETYGTYDEYITYDAPDAEINCPICECDTSNNDGKYDNYTGFRIYKNEHAAYAYTFPNGHHDELKRDNFGFGSVVGNILTDFLRVEYETLYMGSSENSDDHDFDYDIWANMLNAYLFQEFSGVVAPYIGAGIGLTGIWGEVDGELDNAFDLSYQFMGGVWFDLNNRIAVDVGFKYINYGKVEHKTAVSKVDATQIYLGLSYKFGM